MITPRRVRYHLARIKAFEWMMGHPKFTHAYWQVPGFDDWTLDELLLWAAGKTDKELMRWRDIGPKVVAWIRAHQPPPAGWSPYAFPRVWSS